MEHTEITPAEVAEEIQVETPAEEVLPKTDELVVEEPSGETEIIPEPRKQSAQARIDEITRARREEEREKEYWKKIALGKKQEEMPAETTQPTSPSIPPRPTLDTFDTTEEYEDALLTWHENKKEIVSRAARQQESHEEALRSFNERSKKMRDEYEDFDEIIEAPVFSPVMRAALLHSENGPAVAYYLGLPENRILAEKIRRLPIEVQPYELGKLETQLLIAKKTKKVPGAPTPITPVGMAGGGEKDLSEIKDEAEWFARYREQKLKKLQSKR